MWPNQRPYFNDNRGPRFPRMNPQHNIHFANYYDLNYRTPGPTNIIDLRLPNTVGPRMISNPLKRKAEELPNNDVRISKPEKRPRMDLPVLNGVPPANPPNLTQKKNKKNKGSQEDYPYQALIDFANTNKIFELPLSRDESSYCASGLRTIELPSTEDTEFIRLFNHPFVVNVDNQMKRKVDYLALPESKCSSILKTVIDDLNESIVIPGYSTHWNCFGSYLYGLVSENSDIDLYLECENLSNGSPYPRSELPTRVRNALKKKKKFSTVTYIKNARVPLVRVIHGASRKQLDISFSSKLGIWNSLLTKLFLSLNPNLKYLTLYLKEILKRYDTLGTGKITTHILFWLVAFFMQQKRLLPSVSAIRNAATSRNYDSGWDCSLPENYSYRARPVSLYSLLLEFFFFYKDFDFLKYVICPFLGRVFLLSDFEQMKLPRDKYDVYFKQLENPKQTMFSRSVFNLQDPTDLSFNLSKQVEITYANKFKIICHCLSNLLPKSVSELGVINNLSQVIPYRLNFNHYPAHDLTQYWSFNLRPKNWQVFNLLNITRKIMELIFGFEKQRIIIDKDRTYVYFTKGSILKTTASVIYFEYCSTVNTWRNSLISSIIPRNEGELRVHLTCDVCHETKLVRVLVQSESNFVRFLQSTLMKLYWVALAEEKTVRH